ncbi:MAG TPA: hypothetical protein VGI39_20390, partial [Polyangiaceae bacterium]
MGIVCLSPPDSLDDRPDVLPCSPHGSLRRSPGTSLARLRAREIDLASYLECKVAEATAHLRRLPARQRNAIRAALLREL